jgi:hypothetical protein
LIQQVAEEGRDSSLWEMEVGVEYGLRDILYIKVSMRRIAAH